MGQCSQSYCQCNYWWMYWMFICVCLYIYSVWSDSTAHHTQHDGPRQSVKPADTTTDVGIQPLWKSPFQCKGCWTFNTHAPLKCSLKSLYEKNYIYTHIYYILYIHTHIYYTLYIYIYIITVEVLAEVLVREELAVGQGRDRHLPAQQPVLQAWCSRREKEGGRIRTFFTACTKLL
jgi:hypothetical protein